METEKMMKLPRCGVKDIIPTKLQQRVRRYVITKYKWQHLSLTYKISKYSNKISKIDVDKAATKSFKVS